MGTLAPRQRVPQTRPLHRDQFILDCCRAQQVLHLACVAWPATVELYDSGQLLHRKLQTVCRRLAGMDIDSVGLEALRSRGVGELYQADLLNSAEVDPMFSALGFAPDWIIAGELLEHLSAPGTMLENMRRHMTAHTQLLITVPNAFSWRGILHLLCGREKVRTDHVAYYSYSTLHELIRRAGLQITEFHWYRDSFPRHPLEKMVEICAAPLLYFRPQFSTGLIAVCRRASD